jgi:hypothetical protein
MFRLASKRPSGGEGHEDHPNSTDQEAQAWVVAEHASVSANAPSKMS